MTEREFKKKVLNAYFERKKMSETAYIAFQEVLARGVSEKHEMAARVVVAMRRMTDIVEDEMDLFFLNENDVNIDNAKKWCFFLTTMTTQIKAFAENTPLTTGGDKSDGR